jgi:tripartite-type tricarboxylate transporter receptor subunit TctC
MKSGSTMIRTTMLAALAALGVAMVAPVAAQPYPNRPVKIIVPTPAGGPVDVMARLLANALPAALGQNVIVENRAGAGNTLGSKAAAAADPDGYTLLVSAASGLIMSPMVYKSAGYDENSFAPIALIAETPQVLVAYPATPFNSVAALVAYAKANPGKLNYSTGGAGTLPHLTAELFKQLSGSDIVHVPYKGGGPALTDVVAGQVQMTFDTAGTSLQFIRDGRLKALRCRTRRASPNCPKCRPCRSSAMAPSTAARGWRCWRRSACRRQSSRGSIRPPTRRCIRSP